MNMTVLPRMPVHILSMNYTGTISDRVKVEVIVREGCRYSDRVLNELAQIRQDFPDMAFEVVLASDSRIKKRSRGGITPSIWVNDKLWFLGTFCSEKFYSKMRELLNPS